MKQGLFTRSRNLTLAAFVALSLVGFCDVEGADKSASTEAALKIGFVNFRKCVEESKVGKMQQASFEAMQSQMENSLMELQKALNEITAKLSDEDYLDGLSPEAENELKHKYRSLGQELSRTQGQYVQTLQDANMKVLQMISSEVAEASKEVAAAKALDLVVNEEAAFFYKPSMDLSSQVIAQMDAKFEREQKNAPVPASAAKPVDSKANASKPTNVKGK